MIDLLWLNIHSFQLICFITLQLQKKLNATLQNLKLQSSRLQYVQLLTFHCLLLKYQAFEYFQFLTIALFNQVSLVYQLSYQQCLFLLKLQFQLLMYFYHLQLLSQPLSYKSKERHLLIFLVRHFDYYLHPRLLKNK
jgi:hypothetical protein